VHHEVIGIFLCQYLESNDEGLHDRIDLTIQVRIAPIDNETDLLAKDWSAPIVAGLPSSISLPTRAKILFFSSR
jgi:hypothetical protein